MGSRGDRGWALKPDDTVFGSGEFEGDDGDWDLDQEPSGLFEPPGSIGADEERSAAFDLAKHFAIVGGRFAGLLSAQATGRHPGSSN